MGVGVPERVDVAIVGAGFAGLATAEALRGAGLSVVVLEARDRAGGRTLTRDIAGGAFDLGGQWLGAGQHRFAALVRRCGVTTFPTFHAGAKLLDDGTQVSRYTGAIPALRPLELLELHVALRRIERRTARVSARDPLSSPDAAELDGRTLADEARRIRSKRVRELLATAVGTVFGVEPAELSLLFFLSYLRAGGGLMKLCEIEGGAQEQRLVGGVGALATRWAQQLGCVVTGAPVRSIRHTATEVSVRSERGVVAARRAVVAVPPPVATAIELDPPAPPRRAQLTQRYAMGALVKVIAVYERPFWRDRGLSGEAIALRPSPIATVFDNSLPDGPAALVGFIQAEAARRHRSGAPFLDQLARWFGDAARHPIATDSLDWCAEPYSLGCPTAVAATRALTSTGTTLREPIGRIHFAGTETASEWTGYIEGALESGERVAREILRAL